MKKSLCPSCGSKNGCSLAKDGPIEDCWCMKLPPSSEVPSYSDAACYCRECFEKVFGKA